MVPAVVLAAGLSSRMGRTKAILPLGPRETFLTRILHTLHAAEVADAVVVLGHDADAVRRSLEEHGLSPRLVLNTAFQSGQFSSVVAGINAIDHPGVTGVLLCLVDVPLVSVSTVRAVLDRRRESGAPIVRPARGRDHGHPVLIDRALFGEIRSADPARGLKPVVRAHLSSIGDVPVDDDGAFFDIDTPAEYASALEQLVSS